MQRLFCSIQPIFIGVIAALVLLHHTRVATSFRQYAPSTGSFANAVKSASINQLMRENKVFGKLRMEESPVPPNVPGKPSTPPLPVIVPKVEDGRLDIVSRLLKDRILILGNQVTDEVANALVAQMMFLATDDPKKDIKLYINSPGGSVTAGMAIFDTMQYIPCDVETVCFGSASSMAAFLLSAGTKGKRKSMPNSRIMIHQPLGGAHGQAADIEIQTKEILFTRQTLNTFLSHMTGQPINKIEEDTDRNFFMTPEEAKAYGLIDEVLQTKLSHVNVAPMPTLV